MTVAELIAQLQELEPTLTVMVSSDAEGNEIKDMEGWSTMYFSEEDESFFDEADYKQYVEEEDQLNYEEVLIIYPF